MINLLCNITCRSVVYKEQVRQNQAATEALTARLEAQMAICKSAEKELHKRFKQRDELEKRTRPEWEARKRSRSDDDPSSEEKDNKTLIHLPRVNTKTPLHKELRIFLDEEQKLSEEAISSIEGRKQAGEEIEEERLEEPLRLTLGPEIVEDTNIRFPFAREAEVEEDEESRKERGKGNVEKWLHMLLGDAELVGDDLSPPHQPAREPETSKTDEIIKMLNEKYPQKEMKVLKHDDAGKNKEDVVEKEPKKQRSVSTPRRLASSETNIGKGDQLRRSFERGNKDKGLARSESARSLRPILSSPSMILHMRKGVDCIRKKPLVINDEEDEYGNENLRPLGNSNFLKSSSKSIRKGVKI